MDNLDRQRQRFEENVEKLRRSIKIWQTWEAEYEGLKEELQILGKDAPVAALQEIGHQCNGEFLNQKEVNLLLRDDKKQPRSSQQVIGLLSRRMDYVQCNIKSLHGSLQAAEDKLNASQAFTAAQQKDEEGFPLVEIQEELDENDNVVSSSMIPASEAAPQVVEALRKAGLPALQPPALRPQKVDGGAQQALESRTSDKVSKDVEKAPSALKQSGVSRPKPSTTQQISPSTSESDTKGSDGKGGRRRKSVTFADGTKQAPPTPTQPQPAKDVQAAKAASRARRIKAEVRGSIDALRKVHNAGYINEEIFDRFRKEYVERLHNLPPSMPKQLPTQAQSSRRDQGKLAEKESNPEVFEPVIPSNEAPENAALRQDMIRYNMNEVGSVVAEMDLDDEDQGYFMSSECSTEEGEYRGSSDEDDNDWGISTDGLLTQDYIKEMQALEQKLKAGSTESISHPARTPIETLLKVEDDLAIGLDGNAVRQTPEGLSASQEKRAVRFAQDLDVQEQPPSTRNGDRNKPNVQRASTSVHTDVIERPPEVSNLLGSAAPKQASRFKTMRSGQLPPAPTPKRSSPFQITASNGNQMKTPSLPAFTPPATPKMTPTGPPGQTHASTVVERQYPQATSTNEISEPDEFDASLMRQELLMDYHRTRNRMMQRQGGFLADDKEKEQEEAEGPMVDKNGTKISRFKAARLKGLGG